MGAPAAGLRVADQIMPTEIGSTNCTEPSPRSLAGGRFESVARTARANSKVNIGKQAVLVVVVFGRSGGAGGQEEAHTRKRQSLNRTLAGRPAGWLAGATRLVGFA